MSSLVRRFMLFLWFLPLYVRTLASAFFLVAVKGSKLYSRFLMLHALEMLTRSLSASAWIWGRNSAATDHHVQLRRLSHHPFLNATTTKRCSQQQCDTITVPHGDVDDGSSH